MLLRLLDLLDVKSIALAGFDGYDYTPNNFASEDLELANVYETPEEINKKISKMLIDYLLNRKNNINIKFITHSHFEEIIDFLENENKNKLR